MVIWIDSVIKIWDKIWHVHGFKKKDKLHKDFTLTHAEIPVGQINEITHQWEPVENHRGNAYALRRAKKYRNKKAYNRRVKFKK